MTRPIGRRLFMRVLPVLTVGAGAGVTGLMLWPKTAEQPKIPIYTKAQVTMIKTPTANGILPLARVQHQGRMLGYLTLEGGYSPEGIIRHRLRPALEICTPDHQTVGITLRERLEHPIETHEDHFWLGLDGKPLPQRVDNSGRFIRLEDRSLRVCYKPGHFYLPVFKSISVSQNNSNPNQERQMPAGEISALIITPYTEGHINLEALDGI